MEERAKYYERVAALPADVREDYEKEFGPFAHYIERWYEGLDSPGWIRSLIAGAEADAKSV